MSVIYQQSSKRLLIGVAILGGRLTIRCQGFLVQHIQRTTPLNNTFIMTYGHCSVGDKLPERSKLSH